MQREKAGWEKSLDRSAAAKRKEFKEFNSTYRNLWVHVIILCDGISEGFMPLMESVNGLLKCLKYKWDSKHTLKYHLQINENALSNKYLWCGNDLKN